MEILPLKLRKNGFDYIQVLRGTRTCLYEQMILQGLYYYEVFLIKTMPKRKMGNRMLEAKECFPHNEAFGYWAWTFRNYEEAIRKFNDLENGTNNNSNANTG